MGFMPRKSKDEHTEILSKKTIRWAAILVVTITVCSTGALLWLLNSAGDARITLDIIRTAGTIGVGSGGGIALLLTARRQRSSELAAENTRHDATERRITELQTQAGEQLGSPQAIVRLNGLYSLERLAESHTEFRQIIVNLICSYLRMPFMAPAEISTFQRSRSNKNFRRDIRLSRSRPVEAKTQQSSTTSGSEEELQVRVTAQRILAAHLCPYPNEEGVPTNRKFWPDMEIDLRNANLVDFDFTGCHIRSGSFNGATFTGPATFHGCEFRQGVYFSGARFTSLAAFSDSKFRDVAQFPDVSFDATALFSDARFLSSANFNGAKIASALFNGIRFEQGAYFRQTHIGFAYQDKILGLDRRSPGSACFDESMFSGEVRFDDARFDGLKMFRGIYARVDGIHGEHSRVWPLDLNIECPPSRAFHEFMNSEEGRWGRLTMDVKIPDEIRALGISDSAARMAFGDPTIANDEMEV